MLLNRNLVLGIGCSSGASVEDVQALAQRALAEMGSSVESVAEIASIDLKRSEPGLLAFAARWHLPLRWFSAAELRAVEVPNPSPAVAGAAGTPSVAEAAAILAAEAPDVSGADVASFPEAASIVATDAPKMSAAKTPGVTEAVAIVGAGAPNTSAVGMPNVAEAAAMRDGGERLLVPKRKSATVTVAVARRKQAGKLAVVGIGPGGREQLTYQALETLRRANVIVGYKLYTDMVREWLPLASCRALPLGEEVERARLAIELARGGRRVALVSSGDAGIYALAGLVYEELGDDAGLHVEVIPGITAAGSTAALLGAPLMADFATISLSDLHVPAGVIRGRLTAAAAADLVTVLYNPASERRRHLLAEAREIFLQQRAPSTPVGLVRNAYRSGQSVHLSTLHDLPLDEVDMFTIVIIGSSSTSVMAGRMVTRRQAV
jgi:cobalt-precorrin 5A hydrolase / precorrin-3B C17-methyltransferase